MNSPAQYPPNNEDQPLLPIRHDCSANIGLRRQYRLTRPRWLQSYHLSSARADIVGAVTVASLYIPLCFSFAALGHVPPASSLYAFVFHPPIYALLGTSPLMIVGPEATGSLLVGAAVERIGNNVEDESNADVAGVATSLAGVILLTAGSLRLGFMECLLNRAFMKGFIGGVGVVLMINQIIPGLGLSHLEKEAGLKSRSAVTQIVFFLTHFRKASNLNTLISVFSLGCVLLSISLKKRFAGSHQWVGLVPDRFFVLMLASFTTAWFGLDEKGVQVIGTINAPTPTLPILQWPFYDWTQMKSLAGTSMLIALLGYFESSVTSRSLSNSQSDGRVTTMQNNPDRELVVLGAANIVGGCFTTLPAFGGFGRSKLNAQSGGKTQMSNVFLSMISLLCALFISPCLYYVPKPALAAMSFAVGISMVEEFYHDIIFFWSIRGWPEMALMVIVLTSIMLHSMSLGIALGLGLTVMLVIRSSGYPRAKSSLTTIRAHDQHEVESGCTSIEIIGCVTFYNVNGLAKKVQACLSDSTSARNLLLDCTGVQRIDACSVQILVEMMRELTQRDIRVILVLPLKGFTTSNAGIATLKSASSQCVISREEARAFIGQNCI